MNENEHIKLIESALSDIESRVSAIHIGTSDLGRQLAEAEGQRDYHRDDAAMVRRERDTEINRLAGELAQARARAERWKRYAEALEHDSDFSTDEEIAELRAACADLEAHGDVDVPGEATE